MKHSYGIGDKVIHPADRCPFEVVGIRADQIEIKGDWSGGIQPCNETSWVDPGHVKPYVVKLNLDPLSIGVRYVHYKSKKTVEIRSFGLVQINDVWLPSVNYQIVSALATPINIANGVDYEKIFTRTSEDFAAKFEAVDDIATGTINEPDKKAQFDLKSFKKYVMAYKDSDSCYNTNIFIKDMLYGIGLAVNAELYREASGYNRFRAYLKNMLSVKPKKKLKR